MNLFASNHYTNIPILLYFLNNSFTFALFSNESNQMNINTLHHKALELKPLSLEEGIMLYRELEPSRLFSLAQQIRFIHVPEKRVSWQIDRNINYTNVCISGCLFCNFHCKVSEKDKSYTINEDELKEKIAHLRELGGDQILLQGGLHPLYDINYYEELLKTIKSIDPGIKLNAFGPPEVSHIAKLSSLSVSDTLKRLVKAGLDTLPGAGAEILSDRVRKTLSPGKPTSGQWLDVMGEAHKLGLGTTATMVYGHIETLEERIEHLLSIRDLQARKPLNSPGFRAFICWPMQTEGTKFAEKFPVSEISAVEHLKMTAISRIMLNNVKHIQASWLTVGKEIGMLALHSGADDMGSIMIEENVVSSAGAEHQMGAAEMQNTIIDSGFEPWLRGQDYMPRVTSLS